MAQLDRDATRIPMFDVPASFLDDLSAKDYHRLYNITLKVYREQHPGKPDPSPLVINGMINEVGQKTAMYLLKKAVDAKIID